MALLMPTESARFVARAYGMALPARAGWTGVSASGWTIRDTDQREFKAEDYEKWRGDGDEMASAAANRRAREANIRAIRGVLESSFLPAGAAVEILMRDKEVATTFNEILAGKTRKTNDKPFAHMDLWDEIRPLVVERGLKVRMRWVQKQDDMDMDLLEECVKDAARERQEQLSDGDVRRSALPPKPNPNKPPQFPPVDEE